MRFNQMPIRLPLHARPRILEPVLQQAHVGMMKFFLLAKHVLPHSHFAEVVQQRRISNLAQLLFRKHKVPQLRSARPVHRLCQMLGVTRNAERMSGSHRIPLLDRLDRRANESFQQSLDIGIKLKVFQGNGGFRAHAGQHLKILFLERIRVRRRVHLNQPQALALQQ